MATVGDLDVNVDTETDVKMSVILLHKHGNNPNEVNKVYKQLSSLETPSFMRPLEDRTVARGETAVLQCIAGGSPAPRLNWTKDDGPLLLTERHFFAAANQLLIIVDVGPADTGKYTCIMSNTLGTERGHIYLSISPSSNCDTGAMYDQDGWTTVGIVVIVVVCCVVGTSLVWVIVIYHMRRRSEDYSITNTGLQPSVMGKFLSVKSCSCLTEVGFFVFYR